MWEWIYRRIVSVFTLCKIISWKKNVNANNKINYGLINNYVTDTNKINFKDLKKKNKDTIAYLKVEGTNIDYVVLQGNDNKYYLSHNFNKEYNVAGWIFADYHNKFDSTDKNIVIYGHDTKDGSMFGSLKSILTKKWQRNKKNHIIKLITEKKVLKYKVFSTYTIKPENYYINTEFISNDSYSSFLKTIQERSIYNYNTNINPNDRIMTLSSCIGDGSKRVVLHAKLINN